MLDPLNVLILDGGTSRARGLFELHFHSNPWGCAVDHKSIPVIKKTFGRKTFSHLRLPIPPTHTLYPVSIFRRDLLCVLLVILLSEKSSVDKGEKIASLLNNAD